MPGPLLPAPHPSTPALTRPATAPRNTLSMTTEEWVARLSAATSSSKKWHSSTPDAGSRTLLGWGADNSGWEGGRQSSRGRSMRTTSCLHKPTCCPPPPVHTHSHPQPHMRIFEIWHGCTHQMYGCSTSHSLAPAKDDIDKKRHSTLSGNLRKSMRSVCCPPSPSIMSPLCRTLPARVAAGCGTGDGHATDQH